MKGARELAESNAAFMQRVRAAHAKLSSDKYELEHDDIDACPLWYDGCNCVKAILSWLPGLTDRLQHADSRLAAIDSAAPGEVGQIDRVHRAVESHRNVYGIQPRDAHDAHRDRGILLAVVQRQAGEMAELRAQPAISMDARLSADLTSARAEVERLKERAARDDAGVTIHACPPTDSGIMPCCGRTPFEVMADRMTTKPEFVNCDRVRLQTERTALAQENARLINEVGELDAAAREQRLRAEVLARGLAAYRSGGYTQGQLWENEEGKAVT